MFNPFKWISSKLTNSLFCSSKPSSYMIVAKCFLICTKYLCHTPPFNDMIRFSCLFFCFQEHTLSRHLKPLLNNLPRVGNILHALTKCKVLLHWKTCTILGRYPASICQEEKLLVHNFCIIEYLLLNCLASFSQSCLGGKKKKTTMQASNPSSLQVSTCNSCGLWKFIERVSECPST